MLQPIEYVCEECGWEGIWTPKRGLEVRFDPRENVPTWIPGDPAELAI